MKHEHKSQSADGELRLCYGGWDKDLEPGIRYGPVIRDTYLIECCTGGFGSVIINGREFEIKGGDCYFLLPGDTVIHTASFEEPRRGVFCSLEGLQIGGILTKAGITSLHPFAPDGAFQPITDLVEKLVRMKDAQDAGARYRRLACMYEIFGVLLACTGAAPEKSDPVQKAIHMMEARYHEELSVSRIAGEVGLDRCYFSTQFKAQTGFSPYQYLSRLRIRKACALLEHTLCDVTTAANAVGIPPENFARIFGKWMHMTPSSYRKSIADLDNIRQTVVK